jgi:hypothetical protein
MRYVYKNDCSRVYEETSVFIDEHGTQYGPDWRKASIVGMQGVIETPPPDPALYIINGHSLQIVDGLPTVVWDYRAKTAEELTADRRRHISSQIEDLEHPSGAPRWVREAAMVAMVTAAQVNGVSEPQLYTSNPGYRRAKDLETAVNALRAQLNN